MYIHRLAFKALGGAVRLRRSAASLWASQSRGENINQPRKSLLPSATWSCYSVDVSPIQSSLTLCEEKHKFVEKSGRLITCMNIDMKPFFNSPTWLLYCVGGVGWGTRCWDAWHDSPSPSETESEKNKSILISIANPWVTYQKMPMDYPWIIHRYRWIIHG